MPDSADCVARLHEAVETLTQLRDEARKDGQRDQYRWEDSVRLSGKIEGVKLALSYLAEHIDGSK